MCVHAQPDPGDLLQRVTQEVLDTVGRLPKYMCTQTVDRSQYEPTAGSAGHPCEPYARKQLRLTTSDRLRLDVAVSGGRELYSWVGKATLTTVPCFNWCVTAHSPLAPCGVPDGGFP